jgi:hypothetical protein
MSGPFGWDYPAGAENDPDAPWNQRDDAKYDGETRQEMRDRIAEEKADAARDEEGEKGAQK